MEAAGIESLKELQRQSRRVMLDSRGLLEERYARQHKLREFTSWVDDEGMTAGRFRLTPDVGAAVVNKIRREQDRLFRKAYKEGRRESPQNYAADAFAALVTGQGAMGDRTRSKGSEVVVVVSREALLRGEVDTEAGELCEVPGFGAISVTRARQMLSDCFLKGVLVDGKKIVTVKHFGRHRPAELDAALLVTSVLEHGQVMCVVEGCDQSVRIQRDHKQAHGRGGPTSVDNLHPMCGRDNRDKEQGLAIKTADGRWVRVDPGGGERSHPDRSGMPPPGGGG